MPAKETITFKGSPRNQQTEPFQPLFGPSRPAVLEALEGRTVPAVIGAFTPGAGGMLTIFGDALNNSIAVSRNAAGQILINGGAVPIQGGPSTVANTNLIQVFGQARKNTITLYPANRRPPPS